MKTPSKPKPIRPSKRILWAVDVFADDPSLQRAAARLLSSLPTETPAMIEPVYLFSSEPLDVPPQIFSQLFAELQQSAEQGLHKLLRGIPLPKLAPLKILSNGHSTRRLATDLLTEYAHQVEATLIVLSTHGRKGIKRAFLGSFAETLLFYSDLPLLLVNPHWKRAARIRQILFPTDFSEPSQEAYNQALSFAERLGAGLTLYHKIPHFIPPAADFAWSYPYTEFAGFEAEIKERRAAADPWVATAAKRGIPVKTVIDSRIQESVADGIINESNKGRHGLIIMAAHSGPIRFALLGSTARAVIRNSAVPVWLIRSHSEQIDQQIRKKAA